jgi:alkanesulfonate monooxygenase SsuD/methylene tetrahydromethanopterin reductase-like flavin-dependent oxidoreductase (luciferase family)
VPDALVAAVGLAGTPETCRERVEAYRRSGTTLPVINPMTLSAGRDGKQDVMDAIRACAP